MRLGYHVRRHTASATQLRCCRHPWPSFSSRRITAASIEVGQDKPSHPWPLQAAAAENRAASNPPRHYFLRTSRGLEQVLEAELTQLGIEGEVHQGEGGVSLEGSDEAFWSAVLQSRLVESAQLLVGKPFHAPYEATLRNHSRGVSWSDYIWFGSKPLDLHFKVTTLDSRMFHKKMVEQHVSAAIEEQRQKLLQAELQEVEDREFYARPDPPPPPTVFVDIQKDECRLSIAALQEPHPRAYMSAAAVAASMVKAQHGEDAILADLQEGRRGGAETGPQGLWSTHAAACIYRSRLLEMLEDADAAGEELLVWDPFCGSGVMLMELLGVLLGIPPASPEMPMPFVNFPCFQPDRFKKLLQTLTINPHPAVRSLNLLGTDTDPGQIQAAHAILAAFRRVMPRKRFMPLQDLPCKVTFRCLDGMKKLPSELKSQRLVILTNTPYGSKSKCGSAARAYRALGQVVDWQAKFGKLQAAYCVAAREYFRRGTALEWRTELRFWNAGMRVELLRWTGQQTVIEKEQKPRKQKRRVELSQSTTAREQDEEG